MPENFSLTKNMRFYSYAKETPKEALKQILAGRLKGMSDVNPMFRIKALTEMFGPCGIGWWTEVTRQEVIEDPLTKQRSVFLDILLFYKDPETGEVSHGIFGTGGSSLVAQERNGPYFSDEAYKMAYTDAISVACKALGIAADTYWQRDTTKYDPYLTPDAPAPAPRPKAEPPKPESKSAPKPEPKAEAKAENAEPPQTITAVVDYPANPESVSQEMLTNFGAYIRDQNKRTAKSEKEFSQIVKKVNGGSNNYRAIDDPETRKAVYAALYNRYFVKEENA